MVWLELMREAAVEKYIADRNLKTNEKDDTSTMKEVYSEKDTISENSTNSSITTPKGGKKPATKLKKKTEEDMKMPASS